MINKHHPGEHLLEFLDEFNITPYRLAKDIHVPATRIDQIIKCKRSVTADTAIRLGKYFGNSSEFWLNLQQSYNLYKCEPDNFEEITPIVECA